MFGSAHIAEVCGAEAEEDGHRAAVAALVLQVVCPVLRAHLGLERQRGQMGRALLSHLADVAAAAADQLLRVEGIPDPGVQVTARLAAEVRLAALEADVVLSVALHGEPYNCISWRSTIC